MYCFETFDKYGMADAVPEVTDRHLDKADAQVTRCAIGVRTRRNRLMCWPAINM